MFDGTTQEPKDGGAGGPVTVTMGDADARFFLCDLLSRYLNCMTAPYHASVRIPMTRRLLKSGS